MATEPTGSTFEWNVNPSTRPVVAGRDGRDAVATAVIVNYDQIDGQPYVDWGNGRVEFESPRPRTENPDKEAWTFTCRRPGGAESAPRAVIVDRGQRIELGDACATTGAARKG